ncbi:MAG: hypothetical protein F6K10_43060, partial [Moorea sp. SIO2B7]|nr:hypothetical protein [Moorena sp. SIO2B7]
MVKTYLSLINLRHFLTPLTLGVIFLTLSTLPVEARPIIIRRSPQGQSHIYSGSSNSGSYDYDHHQYDHDDYYDHH